MKKTIVFFTAILALIFMLAACSGSAGSVSSDESLISESNSTESVVSDVSAVSEISSSEKETKTESNGTDILIVYFSRTGEQYGVENIDKGNTEIVAEIIAEKTGADLYEVVPVEDYPMTYDELTDVAKQEKSEGSRPEISGELPEITDYDTIIIGAPVWWGDWPMIMYTYFESNDFSGKTLIPFSTHAGSGLSGFDSKLQSEAPEATVLSGLGIAGTECQNNQEIVKNSVNDWLDGLGY